MALAYLCREWQVTQPELNLSVKAFVVDHKFRDESTEEAHMVAKWLSDLGIYVPTKFVPNTDYPRTDLIWKQRFNQKS